MKITEKIDTICWIINFLFCILMLINIIWLALENYDLRQDILKKRGDNWYFKWAKNIALWKIYGRIW